MNFEHRKHIQNHVKHLRWKTLSYFNYFHQKFYLRYLKTEYPSLVGSRFSYIILFCVLYYTFYKSSFIITEKSNILSKSSCSGNTSKFNVWRVAAILSYYSKLLKKIITTNEKSAWNSLKKMDVYKANFYKFLQMSTNFYQCFKKLIKFFSIIIKLLNFVTVMCDDY